MPQVYRKSRTITVSPARKLPPFRDPEGERQDRARDQAAHDGHINMHATAVVRPVANGIAARELDVAEDKICERTSSDDESKNEQGSSQGMHEASAYEDGFQLARVVLTA